ncbi:Citrate lyase subunit beta-like protein [Frankia canadensis]|uniref:Citrate lyase subunit beta-like protein n=1 Tax=Frankia canadensis TaxID=1836972 RepID=A0A2I2KIA8_9ACTN|nr:CoA ester lyase [Frankia canadensis]SNQ45396.1 Citrate lyase subunit beta-like protein [Frankia canadensis]SOU52686.1 Citrate lyase subunit beta-like protein [Frankia canadensis]
MRQSLSNARSLLFVPGDDAYKVDKALNGAADAVVIDLEDAVLRERKDQARTLAVDAVGAARGLGPLVVVRINAPDSRWGAADLADLANTQVDALMLPKATPEALALMPADSAPVIALVETAAGLRSAYEIARDPRVAALALGGADLGAELGLEPLADGAELMYARSRLVVDAAAAGSRRPFDAVHLAATDPGALRAEAVRARALGMGGKLCIHPAQVSVVHEVFTPSKAEVERARRVLAALDEAAAGGAAVAVADGRLVDEPVARQARMTLRLAAVH